MRSSLNSLGLLLDMSADHLLNLKYKTKRILEVFLGGLLMRVYSFWKFLMSDMYYIRMYTSIYKYIYILYIYTYTYAYMYAYIYDIYIYIHACTV